MAEIYTGYRFKYINSGKETELNFDISSLVTWCQIFNENGFTPPYNGGSSGNLSIRIKPGEPKFIITSSYTDLGKPLNISNFSEVISCDTENNTVYAKGKNAPSSETFMHYLIYKNRQEINAVFHGHSNEIMKIAAKKGFPVTKKELPYGTINLAKDAVETLKNDSFVILKNHGFISVGKSADEAGRIVLNLLNSTK